MSKFGFDLNEYASEDRNYDPIPKGDYMLSCTEAVEKTTKSGGTMIAATFEVLGGKYSGRKIWNNFNIHNSSEVAQKIGREQVAAWAKAAGKPNATSFDDLIDKSFKAAVGIEKGTGGYSDKNRIEGYIISSSLPPEAIAKIAKTGFEDMKDDLEALEKAAPKSSKKKNPWD
jgi:hypothetical protein